MSKIAIVLIVLLIAVTVGSVGWYVMVVRNNTQTAKATALPAGFENPFDQKPSSSFGQAVTPAPTFANPFAEVTPTPTAYQNPFDATPTGTSAYQNPFEKLR